MSEELTQLITAGFADLASENDAGKEPPIEESEEVNEEAAQEDADDVAEDATSNAEAETEQTPKRQAPKGRRAKEEFEEKQALRRELEELKQWKQQQELRSQIAEENSLKTLQLLKGEEAQDPEEQLNAQLKYYGVSDDEHEYATLTEKKALLRAAKAQHETYVAKVESQTSQMVQIIHEAAAHESMEAQVFASGCEAYINFKAHELVTTGQVQNPSQAAQYVLQNLTLYANEQVASKKAPDMVQAIAKLVMPYGTSAIGGAASKKAAPTINAPKNIDRAKALAAPHNLALAATTSQKNEDGFSNSYSKAINAIYND